MIAATPGLHAGDVFAAVVAAAGIALLVGVAALSQEEQHGLSAPVVYLAIGVAGSVLLGLLDVPRLSPVGDALVVERVCEFALIVALFATGLRIGRHANEGRWRPAAVLLAVGMPLTVAAVTGLGAGLMGLSLGAAILLASALAPTDPVLAGDIGVAPPGEEEAGERGLAHGRLTLTVEAGLNDGLVFPLFLLGVLVASRGGVGWIGNWALTDLAYGVAVAVVIGIAAGYGLAALLLPLHERGLLAAGAEHFLAAAAAVGVYGVVSVLDAYGFVAVFLAGLAFRRYEDGHEYNRQLHDGAALLMRLGEMVVVVLLGSMLTFHGLGAPGVAGWAVAAAVVVVVRPLVALVCLAGSDLPLGERALVAWFGVRGVATLYYGAVVVTAGALPGHATERVAWTAAAAVALSVVVHSLTALPVNRRHGSAAE